MRFYPLIICLIFVSCRTTDPLSSEYESENASSVSWPVLDQTKFAEYQCQPLTKSWSNDVAQLNATILRDPIIGNSAADALVDVWYYKVGGFQLPPERDLSCAMKQETESTYSYNCMTDGARAAKSVLILDVSKDLDDEGNLIVSAYDVGLDALDSPLGVSRNRDSERQLKCVPHVFRRKPRDSSN